VFNSEKGKKKMRTRKEEGFALIAAVMANLILLAVGIIAINLSTQDLRMSMKVVGDKKAMSAAEGATHWMMVNFDPAHPGTVAKTNRLLTELADGLEPRSRVTIAAPTASTAGPLQISLAGHDMSTTQWVLLRYDTTVTGRNEDYQTSVTLNVGLGYGPVDSSSY
jgi:Tfp pilus assembly protein PilX